eukprot:tig00020703_g13134.t1
MRQLQRRPLATKAVTSASIAALSDALAQTLAGKRAYVLHRTLKLFLFGFVVSGPAGHFWQQIIERLFRGRRSKTLALEKVIVDQTVFAPFMNAAFIVCMSWIEKRGVWETGVVLKRTLLSVLKANWRVWPLANLINYKYVPVQLRVLFCNIVSLFWTCFLVLKTSTKRKL